MATYTLRDMAQNAGWQVNYDQPTNKVTVINPATKQSISFLSGQGQEYGLGGLINGANVVKDTIKLGSFLTKPQLPTPTQVNTGGIATPSSNNTQGVGGIGNTTGNTKDLGTSQGTPQGIPNTGTPQGIPQGTPQGTGQVTAANALQGSAIPQPPQMTDYSKELEALKQAQIARITGNLTSKYNQTVADINSNINKVAPTYDAKRLQTQSDSQLQAKNFAEFLANRGLSRSGTSQQAELNRNMQLQQAFNQYDKQQADDMAYYQKQLDDARSAYNRDKYNAEQQAESDYLSQLIQTKAKQDEIRNANYWKQYDAERQAKIDEENRIQNRYKMGEEKQKAMEQAFKDKIAGLGDQFDYKGEIQKIKNDGDPSNDWQAYYLMQENQKNIENKLKTTIETEKNTFGFNLNDYQRNLIDTFNNAMKNPEFATMYNNAYNSSGGIAGLMQLAKEQGRDDLIPALEGGRFKKVLSEGLTDYAGQYGLPQEFYQKAYDTKSKAYDSVIKLAKAEVASTLESLGLKKAYNDIVGGNYDNAKKEIEVSYLPQEKQTELLSKIKGIENIDNQIKNRDISTRIDEFVAKDNSARGWQNTSISQQNANTSAYNADTTRMNTNMKQKELNNKEENNAFNILDKQITNTYTSVDDSGRTVLSVQDKKDIDAYTANLINQGVSVDIVNSLRTKYNLPKLPK
jgi:hypothetical protein